MYYYINTKGQWCVCLAREEVNIAKEIRLDMTPKIFTRYRDGVTLVYDAMPLSIINKYGIQLEVNDEAL